MKIDYLKMMREIMEKNDRERLARQNYDYSDVKIQKDISYINDGKKEHMLDILSGKDTGKDSPVLVDIHGGGLVYGTKELNQNFNCELARQGYHVVSLSYELIPHVDFRQQINDILYALSFIRCHGKEYGISGEEVFLVGDSAGALLAFFAAAIMRSEKLQDLFGFKEKLPQVKAMGFISIMFDVEGSEIYKILAPYICRENGTTSEVQSYLKNPSKVLEDTVLPPCFLVTSAEDTLVNDTFLFKRALEQKKVHFELESYEKGKQYPLEHVFSVAYPKYKESQEIYEKIDQFFKVCK